MLTLRLPFESENIESLLTAILSEYPTPPRKVDRSIPPDLEAITANPDLETLFFAEGGGFSVTTKKHDLK